MHVRVSRGFRAAANNSIKEFHQKTVNIDEKIKETLTNLLKRTEMEVPEYGRLFKPISEEFTNPDLTSLANIIKFSVKPSTAKENQTGRILKMEIFSQKGNSISPIFECGNKEEIIKMIKDERFPQKIKQAISEATHALLKKNME